MSIKCYTIGEMHDHVKEIGVIIKKHNIKHVVDVRDGVRSKSYIPLYEWISKKFGVISYTHMDAQTWRDLGRISNGKKLFEMMKAVYENDENFLIIGKYDNPLDCIRFSVVGRILKQLDVFVLHYNENLITKDQTTLEVEMLKNSYKSPIKMKDCYEELTEKSFSLLKEGK